jgi:uncharacterized protein
VDGTSAVARLSIGARAIQTLVRGYQLAVSPMFPPSCRFYPSCSEYALEALRIHGAWRGLGLSVCRICRCNPWNAGGVDPVPSAGKLHRSHKGF